MARLSLIWPWGGPQEDWRGSLSPEVTDTFITLVYNFPSASSSFLTCPAMSFWFPTDFGDEWQGKLLRLRAGALLSAVFGAVVYAIIAVTPYALWV